MSAALLLDPHSPRARELQLLLLELVEGRGAALAALESAARRERGPGPAYAHAFAHHRAGGDRARTGALLRALLLSHPRYGAAYRLLARVELDLGNAPAARALLERSILEAPGYAPSYEGLIQLTQSDRRIAALRAFAAPLGEEARRRLRAAAARAASGAVDASRQWVKSQQHRRAVRALTIAAELLHATGAPCAASVPLGMAARSRRALGDIAGAIRLVERGAAWCEEDGAVRGGGIAALTSELRPAV